MIRPLTVATLLLACGSGLYLYQSKHEAQVLDQTIERTVRDTGVYREQSRLLAAEWTMLNDPETLRRFSDDYLTLKTIAPSQFTSLADLDTRLPPVQDPLPTHAPDLEMPTPVAAAADIPSSVPVATEIAPVNLPDPDGQAPAPAANGVATAASIAERKIVLVKPAAPEPAPRMTSIDQAARQPVAEATPSSHARPGLDPRPPEPRSSDTHVAERRSAQPLGGNGSEVRVADLRPSVPMPLPRPTVVAAASRPIVTTSLLSPPAAAVPMATSRLAAPTPTHASTPIPYAGSLLGMARDSVAAPVPRPTPANAAAFYNTN